MKRVAIIAAEFAPSSLPQPLRVRFFAQHLGEFGWEPTVITTDPRYYECPVDAENECLLPPSLHVIRTPAWPSRFTRKFGIGDIGLRSMWYHWRALAGLCKRGLVDLVCIPVPPYIPMLLGRLAWERFRVPYVIDYGDPWVIEYYWKLPKTERPPKWAMAYALARVLEPIALRRVSHIVGVSQGTNDKVMARYPWLSGVDNTEIPHGGEPADFDYLRAHPRRHGLFEPRDGFLHMSYVGACVPAMFENVRAFFAAVRQGLDRAPGLYSRLRLHFIGSTYSPDVSGSGPIARLARECGISDFVHEHAGRVAYLDALQVMLDSHALLIVGSEEAHYTPSKVFNCILAKRPLLAILHEASSAVRIIQATRAGTVITFDLNNPRVNKVPAISEALDRILVSPADSQPDTCWPAFEKYRTTEAAKRLAHAFNTALMGGPHLVAGAVCQ
jgi:Glycosyl transferase 4-like domain